MNLSEILTRLKSNLLFYLKRGFMFSRLLVGQEFLSVFNIKTLHV